MRKIDKDAKKIKKRRKWKELKKTRGNWKKNGKEKKMNFYLQYFFRVLLLLIIFFELLFLLVVLLEFLEQQIRNHVLSFSFFSFLLLQKKNHLKRLSSYFWIFSFFCRKLEMNFPHELFFFLRNMNKWKINSENTTFLLCLFFLFFQIFLNSS